MDFSQYNKEALAARFREYLGDDADTSREAKRRRSILEAGYGLFLRQGYKKTSIDEVAIASRVAKGTVYLYFKNKADLLVHCVAFEKRVLQKQVEQLFAPETPDRERLRMWLRLTLTAPRDMPLSSRLMTGDHEMWDALDDTKDAKIDAMRDEGRKLCAHLIDLAAPGVFSLEERERRAEVLLAIGWNAAELHTPRVRSGRDLDSFLATMVDVILAGVIHRAEP
jgi:AcrR family transcriptional regulator